MSRDDEVEEVESVRLGRWGLRFADPASERAYVAWQRERTMPYNRAAIYGSLVALVASVVAVATVGASDRWSLGFAAVLFTVSLVLLALTHQRRFDRWIGAAVAGTNALYGSLIVIIYSVHFEMYELSAGAAIVCSFFAFAVNRVRPGHSAVAVAGYMSLQIVLLTQRAPLTAVPLAFEGVLLGIAYGAGMMVAVIIDADGRRACRQERVIESQQRTIAIERARSEEVLKREVSHQVAERARELGAVLARSDVTLDVRRLSAGERFADRYKIIAAVGAGGMGAVYEVERVTDGATLALKAVVGEVSGASAARFAREAEIGASVRHPNLISIVDVGISSGVPFLVMELVRGGSLESQRSKFGDVDWALPLLKQIVEGLAALHDAGVVHRDLKPANVLLSAGGAKISDFGISRFGEVEYASMDPNGVTLAATPKRSAELTGTGVVMGTPLYMAPEAGKSARPLDTSADVFALGIIAYEMLTCRSPFAVPAFMLAVAGQPIPTPPPIDDARVPAKLRALVIDSLAGDPQLRPHVRALAAALR